MPEEFSSKWFPIGNRLNLFVTSHGAMATKKLSLKETQLPLPKLGDVLSTVKGRVMENAEAIRIALQDYRRESLTRFMSEFIPLLRQEGYSLEDLINALADWTDRQHGLSEAVKHLEEAASVVHDIYKQYK